MTALSEIERLVNKVAKSALVDEISLSERVEALKVLTPYYVSLKKERITEDEGPDMNDFAQAMEAPNAQVRGGRGRQ